MSVCLSVCPWVCLWHAGILSKRLQISSKFFHDRVAPPFYFSPHETRWQHSDGDPPNECKRVWNKLSCRRETARQFVSLNILLNTQDHTRSFEMTLLIRACVSPYWYFIETMYVCRTVYETFSVKERRDLETGGRGRSRSLKMAPIDRSYTAFCWSAIVSIAVCCTIFK